MPNAAGFEEQKKREERVIKLKADYDKHKDTLSMKDILRFLDDSIRAETDNGVASIDNPAKASAHLQRADMCVSIKKHIESKFL